MHSRDTCTNISLWQFLILLKVLAMDFTSEGQSNGAGAYSYQDSSGNRLYHAHGGGAPNMAGPQFPSGFPFSGETQMPRFNSYGNSAYAEASVGPGYTRQVAAINPGNPNSRNVYKSNNAESSNRGGYNSVSVSSSSSSSSSSVNGKETHKQIADTVINSNGKITKYHVESP